MKRPDYEILEYRVEIPITTKYGDTYWKTIYKTYDEYDASLRLRSAIVEFNRARAIKIEYMIS